MVHHTRGDQFEMPKDGNRRKQTHHAQNCCFVITLARKKRVALLCAGGSVCSLVEEARGMLVGCERKILMTLNCMLKLAKKYALYRNRTC